jgi:L-amino acid N-acyltransferase YncA
MADLAIRAATQADAAAIAAIYNHYVRETIVTFEEAEISGEEMAARIAAVTANYPWLVGEADGKLIGYAYAGRYQERSAYRHSAISSIYLDHRQCGRGFGKPLYGALLDRLPGLGVHVVLGGIAIPNPASLALHQKLGFHKAGEFAEVGLKFGRWTDVVYLHRLLGAP